MQPDQNKQQLFADWRRLEELPALAPDKFPSYQAAYYAWRANKQLLLDANAVAQIGGRLFFHPERFQTVMLGVWTGLARNRSR